MGEKIDFQPMVEEKVWAQDHDVVALSMELKIRAKKTWPELRETKKNFSSPFY